MFHNPVQGAVRTYFSIRLFASALVLLTMILPHGKARAQLVLGDWVTETSADKIQPAGVPILLRITLTNSAKGPIGYWYGGPGRYPGAHEFRPRVTDMLGKTVAAMLSNGQATFGSGHGGKIEPGDSLTFPAALAPLPPGSYEIQIGKGKPAKVVVQVDPQLVRDRNQDILKRVRQGEPFARFVARKFPTEPVIDGLVRDLQSRDWSISRGAADSLFRTPDLHASVEEIVSQTMRLEMTAEEQKKNRNGTDLVLFAMMAASIGSDATLAAVVSLTHSKVDILTRVRAIGQLGRFKQERAGQELRDLLRDQDEEIRFGAARALADRKDPAGLEVLLAAAQNKRLAARGEAYAALAKFPTDPRVEPALKNGLNDDDEFIRKQAQQALREIQNSGK